MLITLVSPNSQKGVCPNLDTYVISLGKYYSGILGHVMLSLEVSIMAIRFARVLRFGLLSIGFCLLIASAQVGNTPSIYECAKENTTCPLEPNDLNLMSWGYNDKSSRNAILIRTEGIDALSCNRGSFGEMVTTVAHNCWASKSALGN